MYAAVWRCGRAVVVFYRSLGVTVIVVVPQLYYEARQFARDRHWLSADTSGPAYDRDGYWVD